MHQVLVYSDSLSWGIIPNTRLRLPFHQRWPGIVEETLNRSGLHLRMIEDCLNGRRTVHEDPFKAGRNGLIGLTQRIEVNSPLSLVILMLGTNDFQASHPQNDAAFAALGIATLVNAIRTAPIEPGMPIPQILIVSPPHIQTPCGTIAVKFRGAELRSVGLAEAYRQTAADLQCRHHHQPARRRTPRNLPSTKARQRNGRSRAPDTRDTTRPTLKPHHHRPEASPLHSSGHLRPPR